MTTWSNTVSTNTNSEKWKLFSIQLAIFAFAFLITGCTPFYMEKGTTYGEIKIGKPRVTTRERLVNDRLEEEAWLKKQLNKTDDQDFGFQGLSDMRSFTGIFGQAGATYDPGQFSVYQEQQKQKLQDLQRQAELKNLDYQIALKKKQNDLATATSDPTKATGTIYDSLSATTTTSNPASAPTVSTTLDAINQSLGRLNNSVPDPKTVVPTQAKPSPIEQFRDRLAYREEVNNERLQNALDDSHDLHGNTLYRLNFDTTIIPADDTSAWAMVKIRAAPPSENQEPTPEQFAEIVNIGIGQESQSVGDAVAFACSSIRVIKKDELADEAKRNRHDDNSDLVKSLGNCLRVDSIRNTYGYFPPIDTGIRYMKQPRKLMQEQLEEVAKAILAHGEKECKTDNCSLDILVRNFVAEYLAKFQLYNKDALIYSLSTGEFSCGRGECNSNSGRLHGFTYDEKAHRILVNNAKKTEAADSVFSELYDIPFESRDDIAKQLIRKKHISFLGATPKESVQRISDVVARRNATELGLALNAITGVANLNTTLSYINQTDGLFHALRRQPLVVGYTDADSFGWMIGPKYEIKKKNDSLQVGYRHAPVQNGVSGIISVPIFWKTVNLTIEKYWQPEDGKNKRVADFSGKEGTSSNEVLVNLPARLMLAYDLLKTGIGESRPTLDSKTAPVYSVTQGDSASLAILGNHLWRNPMVLLGGQPANKVEVLPDMRGLIAYFDKVQSPGFVKDSDVSVELLVVTAEGSVPAGTVKILKAAEKKVGDGKWEIVGNPYIYPGSPLNLKADASISDGFAKVELDLLSNSKTAGTPIPITDVITDPKKIIVTVPAKFEGNGLQSGDEYQVRVKIYKTPNDANPSIQVIGSIVYYKDSDKPKITADVKSGAVKLTFPDNYELAYPSLKGNKTVNIKVSYSDKAKNESLACTIEKKAKTPASCNLNLKDSASEISIGDGTDAYPSVLLPSK